MSSLPQSYLIELDGNMSPTFLFEQLLERLNAYPIRRAARVERFFPPEVEEEEELAQESHDMGKERVLISSLTTNESSVSFSV